MAASPNDALVTGVALQIVLVHDVPDETNQQQQQREQQTVTTTATATAAATPTSVPQRPEASTTDTALRTRGMPK
jgi:hypothetical protein